MTLGIRVVSPLGLVLCSDSLVTQSERIEVINEPDKLVPLQPSDFRHILQSAGTTFDPTIPTPYLVARNNISPERRIVSTSNNVKKIFQLADLPAGFSMSGAAVFQHLAIYKGGLNHNLLPPEAFMNTILNNTLSRCFTKESYSMYSVGECTSLTLAAGFMANACREGKFEIIGGGFGSEDSFPSGFKYSLDLDARNARLEVLDAASLCIDQYLTNIFPLYCTSRNWFDEFCKEELENMVEYCHINAWWWGLTWGWGQEDIVSKIIPDVNFTILSALQVLSNLLGGKDPLNYLNKDTIEFSEIISIMWKLRESYYMTENKEKLLEIIGKVDVSDRILDLWGQSENSKDAAEAEGEKGAIKEKHGGEEVRSLFMEMKDGLSVRAFRPNSEDEDTLYARLSDDVKSILTLEQYGNLFFILSEYLPTAIIADSQVSKSRNSYHYQHGGVKGTYGIISTGQDDVMDRIMYGNDRKTERAVRSEVKSFQMHAAERLGELINSQFSGVEPGPMRPFDFYGNSISRRGAKSYSDGSESRDDEGPEQGSFNFENEEPSTTHSGSIAGTWSGSISRTNLGKVDCMVEIYEENDGIYKGNGEYLDGLGMGFLLEDLSSTEEGVEFKIKVVESQSEGYKGSGTLTEWGLDLTFEDGGNRHHLILTKNTNFGSTTKDSDLVSMKTNFVPKETLDQSMSALYSELEPFKLPYSESMWKVDFNHMPVETAIEMAQYLMESTIKKQHFNSEVPTVGGEILTAVITKDAGFRLI